MRRQRGFAMLWALILLVFVGTISVGLFEREEELRRDARADAEALGAWHLMEGGEAWARHALLGDAGWRGSEVPVGRHVVTAVVERRGAARWTVRLAARGGRARRVLDLAGADGLPRVVARRR